MPERRIGVVIHYWGRIGVAGVKITDEELKTGDLIHVRGHTTDFTQTVESMQVGDQPVDIARPGDEIGLKVAEQARKHDAVFKIEAD